ncbi:MAG: hypothetical protein NTZ75_08640, partial [Euryarchaeota archaeon]|nr:hypothetical protein [Euryarchaeota archaeon]
MDKYPLIRKVLIPILFIRGGIKMRHIMWKKGLVIGMILLFLGASATLGVSASYTNGQMSRVIQQNIQAIKKDVIGQTCLVGNALISSNTGNDYHPRMTTNSRGHTIVVYEQETDLYHKQVPVVYSADEGQTWKRGFLFDSIYFSSGSGVLHYPDIVYNAPNDLLYLTMVDPNADVYNNEMSFIPGDIANAENASWYGTSGGFDYFYNACACTNNFFLALTTEYANEYSILGLAWFLYPDFKHPPVMGGFYYDGNSVFQSAPAAELEMDSNSNQLFIVCETRLDSGTKITIKTNIMDEGLITSGEQKDGMDKYADPEQMPGEYLGFGTDPDVSGSGNKVCVVYVEDGNVICKSSNTSAVYDPGFNWQVSTVESGASAPAVYMAGNNVYCAYVKGGNLYLKVSEDGGVTWGVAEQKNDVAGTVVAEKGAVDIGKNGIAFTDNRNGNYDIYFAPFVTKPTPIVVIDSISGGFGVTAVIKNYGDATAENFDWSITAEGKIFKGGGRKTGTATLAPEASMTIKIGLMVGFGAVTVTVTADTATKIQHFKLFFIFLKEV